MHDFATLRKLYDTVNLITELKRTAPTPSVLARLAEAKAVRDELLAAGVPVPSAAELQRAKDRRDADLGRLSEAQAARVEARRGTDKPRRRGVR